MISGKPASLLAAGAVSISVAFVALLAGAGNALACVTDGSDSCFRPNYHVQRTDGSLAQWSGPGTGRIVAWLGGNGTAVDVVCETTGPTEDGLPYTVWDKLYDGTYVYGYYLDTPGDGYHPALTTCPESGGGTNPPPRTSPGGGGAGSPTQTPASLPPNKFNTAGAAAWARMNATSNSNPYGYRDDCTDFVSRAMHFGGNMPELAVSGIIPFDHNDDANWYDYLLFGRWIGTYSWGSAPHLLNFLKTTGRAREVSLQAAKPGDLIFVNWGKGGRDLPTGQRDTAGPGGIDHVGMIVGNPGSQGDYDVQIAQHTPNKIEQLSDWREPNPNLHYWIYSVYY